MDNIELGNKLKEHRARLNKTQDDVAQELGISRQTVLFIEKGKYVPSTLLAFRLAKYFGINIDELFYLKEVN